MVHAPPEREPAPRPARADPSPASTAAAAVGLARLATGARGLDRRAVLDMQRGAGNAAVGRLLQRCAHECTCGGTCGGDEAADMEAGQIADAAATLMAARGRLARRSRSRCPAARATRGPEHAPANRLQTRGPEHGPANRLQTRIPRWLMRDLAIEPPRPDATARTLTEAQMESALRFNERVVAVVGDEGLRNLRDVLGVSREPAAIDEDFVNAVVRWQAMYRLTQDGKLGPGSARRLFRELGAEGIARGEVDTGPTYAPTGTISPPVVGGNQRATFRMSARFKHDPAAGVYASCCEVRQHIMWDAASAAAMPGGIPHTGFAAGTAAGTWLEDRDDANNRYGHRTGPSSDPQNFDQYIDTNGRRNQAFGHIFRGSDSPGGPAGILAGSWRFRLSVIDVCNGNAEIGGRDFVRVNW